MWAVGIAGLRDFEPPSGRQASPSQIKPIPLSEEEAKARMEEGEKEAVPLSVQVRRRLLYT